jgi:hypothetical protein
LRRKNTWLLAASVTAYIALSVLIPLVRVFGPHVDMILFTVLFMAVQIMVIRYLCALQMSFVASGIIFLVSLAAFLSLLAIGLAKHGAAALWLPLDVSRIAAAATLGYLVSFALRDKNIVLPIAGFAAYFDIWTVTWGPTKQFIAKAPRMVEFVSAPMPIPGGHGQPAVSFIGPADFVFLAVFFGAIYRLKMEPARTFWFLLPLLSIARIAVDSTPYFPDGIPALVPMSLGVIGANYGHARFSKQEKWSVIIVSVILILALAAFLLHKAVR